MIFLLLDFNNIFVYAHKHIILVVFMSTQSDAFIKKKGGSLYE